MVEEEEKFPWESKTLLLAFISAVAGLLSSFGIIGSELSAEQLSGIATVLFTLIMIVRFYGGGIIKLSD